jgi:hypothetical protein
MNTTTAQTHTFKAVDPLLADARAMIQHAAGCSRCSKAINLIQPCDLKRLCPIGRLLVQSTRERYKELPK